MSHFQLSSIKPHTSAFYKLLLIFCEVDYFLKLILSFLTSEIAFDQLQPSVRVDYDVSAVIL